MTELELRAAATQATEARFRDKPFRWDGAATCIHMLRFHARQMGHTMPTVPKFRSPLTAKRALSKMGYDDLLSLMDSMFPRISPAMMRVGDIMALEGDAGFEALAIRGSATKFLGWHEDAEGCTIVDVPLDEALGAWRL